MNHIIEGAKITLIIVAVPTLILGIVWGVVTLLCGGHYYIIAGISVVVLIFAGATTASALDYI